MEIWDLYDVNDERTGETWERIPGNYKKIPDGRYHMVCDILVQHTDGTYLLTKRHPEKDVYPGFWEASAGGSALSGESPIDCAKRELFEETGIKADEFIFISHTRRETSHSVYYSYLVITDCPKDSIVLQEGETTEYKWVDRAGLIEYLDSDLAIKTHNDRYKDYYEKLRREEVLSKRPEAPWKKDVPANDFISPYPTYECGKYFKLFKECSYTDSSGMTLKYYFYDPTKNGYEGKKEYPLLIFLHGTGNSLVGDLCINYTGAEFYASKPYQDDLGGAYILIPVANEYKGEDGKTKGFWSKEYLEPVHNLIMEFTEEFKDKIGLKFLFGNSSGATFVLRLMDNYMNDFDAVIPVGSSSLAEDSILDEYDRKDKYLFYAIGKRDEFHKYNEEVAPRLEKLKKMKHCFIFIPEWVRNGDKGIASIDGGIEMGQHCLMNAVQINLMFDDGTPMDERLTKGMTGWINGVIKEKALSGAYINTQIRLLRPEDVNEVVEMIHKTIMISNSKDYPPDITKAMADAHTPEFIQRRSTWTHFYVALNGDTIIGCGAIGPYWNSETESSLFTIFVLPEYQRKGVGRAIIEALESDEYFLRANRIEIPASITGVPFYTKMGYGFKNGISEPDEDHVIRMEKNRH